MAIIELFIIVLKTILLSTIYSTIVLLTILFLSKKIESNWIKNRLKKKVNFWLLTHFVISLFLFLFSFSYSNDTGLGDNSIIPIGYGQTIQNEDFVFTYFYPNLNHTTVNKDELAILKYIIAQNKICAEVSHQYTNSPKFDFIVYDLPTKSLITFKSENEYIEYATQYKLPYKEQFYSFREHFREYLNDRPLWKKWLIP